MLGAKHRLQGDLCATRQFNGGGFLNFWVDGANAHIQARHVEDALQLHHIAQVKRVARVVLWNDQEVLSFRADFFDGCLSRLHRQGQHFVGQIVPTTRKQIGVYRRQLKARVANVH